MLRNGALSLLAIIAAPYLYRAIGLFVTTDPFIGLYKQSIKPIDESIGIRMDAVELRDFKGGTLTSSATADRVDVRRDRRAATLYEVQNGLFTGDQGPIHYSAKNAVWNFQTKSVTVTGGVKVRNKDINISALGLVFEDQSNLLKIKGDAKGRLYDGDVVASALIYDMKTGTVDAGPIEWKGMAALRFQGDAQEKPKKWDIKSNHVKSLGNKTDTTIWDNATATDGELIVVAPTVQVNQKTDVLTASGGIDYYSGKADIKADSCVVYRKEKRVVLSGHVFMYVKPKAQEDDPPKIEKLPDFKAVTYDQVVATNGNKPLSKDEQKTKEDEIRSSKNFREFPLVVVSSQIEYWYGKGSRHAVITGTPQGRQALKDDEWRHVWAQKALYDGELETLKLLSTDKKPEALMKNSLGDHMRAEWILVSTKEDDDSIEGNNADGSLYISDDEIPKNDKKQTSPPPPPPTTGGKSGGG